MAEAGEVKRKGINSWKVKYLMAGFPRRGEAIVLVSPQRTAGGLETGERLLGTTEGGIIWGGASIYEKVGREALLKRKKAGSPNGAARRLVCTSVTMLGGGKKGVVPLCRGHGGSKRIVGGRGKI